MLVGGDMLSVRVAVSVRRGGLIEAYEDGVERTFSPELAVFVGSGHT
jgi:hypothetical protein